MNYKTRTNQGGWTIEEGFSSLEEAREAVRCYEEDDNDRGVYEPDWYEIVDENDNIIE